MGTEILVSSRAKKVAAVIFGGLNSYHSLKGDNLLPPLVLIVTVPVVVGVPVGPTPSPVSVTVWVPLASPVESSLLASTRHPLDSDTLQEGLRTCRSVLTTSDGALPSVRYRRQRYQWSRLTLICLGSHHLIQRLASTQLVTPPFAWVPAENRRWDLWASGASYCYFCCGDASQSHTC